MKLIFNGCCSPSLPLQQCDQLHVLVSKNNNKRHWPPQLCSTVLQLFWNLGCRPEPNRLTRGKDFSLSQSDFHLHCANTGGILRARGANVAQSKHSPGPKYCQHLFWLLQNTNGSKTSGGIFRNENTRRCR